MNLKLNLQGTKRVAAGYPWIGVKELEHFKELPPAGTVLRLQDAMGNFLAHAVCEGPQAPLVCRVLSRQRHPAFDAPYFAGLMEQALRRRKAMWPERSGLRVIHGEMDELPGVFCERHEQKLFLRIESPGMEAFRGPIEEALKEQCPGLSILRREAEGWLPGRGEALEEKLPSRVAGLAFWVRRREVEAADFDLEQRLNYARLMDFSLKGESLVVFARRGAWGLAALKAGCRSTLCLERDSAQIRAAQENAELNGMTERFEAQQGDALERVERLIEEGRRFDFIMGELPREASSSRLNFKAPRHGASLVGRLGQLLKEGGIAAFSVASGALSATAFQAMLERGFERQKYGMELAAASRKAEDFPELPGFEFPDSKRFLAYQRKALP